MLHATAWEGESLSASFSRRGIGACDLPAACAGQSTFGKENDLKLGRRRSGIHFGSHTGMPVVRASLAGDCTRAYTRIWRGLGSKPNQAGLYETQTENSNSQCLVTQIKPVKGFTGPGKGYPFGGSSPAKCLISFPKPQSRTNSSETFTGIFSDRKG